MDLDKVVGLTVVIVATGCIALVVVTVVSLAAPSVHEQLGFGSAAVPSYAVGQHLDLPATAYGSSPRTLVVFASSECVGCRITAPFFRTIAERLRGGGLQMRVVMDAPTEARRKQALEYVASTGLDATALEAVALETTRIKRVPTLVLVDQSGTVLSDWEPPLPQEEIFRTLLAVQSAR
jgi:thiol-disulfide isomerase/thioredoxin